MTTRALLILAFALGRPAWPQAVTAPVVEEMKVPPLASERGLPLVPRAEIRTNYVSGAFGVHAGYTDNVYPGVGKPISDQTYVFDSNITLNQLRSRQQRVFTYTSGFALYQRNSQLNQAEHNGSAMFGYRLSPHSNLTLRDVFDKSSSAFGAGSPFMAGGSGAAQTTTPGIVVPFADRITNTGESELTWQYGPHAMVIGSGLFSDLRYPHPSQALGIFDSSSREGSASWAREISNTWYAGLTGRYSRTSVFPHNDPSKVVTESLAGFVTLYLNDNMSLSASAGPQRVESGPEKGTSSVEWSPAIRGTLGWQASRATFSASYSRQVTSGGGLVGSYLTTSGGVSARWLISQRWAAGVMGAYTSSDNVGAKLAGSVPNGESKGGSVSLERRLGTNARAVLEYDRLNQVYPGLAAIATSPDTSRVMLSLSYQFSRPLGR